MYEIGRNTYLRNNYITGEITTMTIQWAWGGYGPIHKWYYQQWY